jgi:predicted DNA-binding transcriptional regulator YafY
MRARLAAIPNKYDVSVVFRAPSTVVAGFVGQWAAVEPVDADSCRMRMNVDDLNWPLWVLGGLGADFTIESPAELRTRVRTAAETLLRGAA